jgi:short-subunit dehydrogenase
MKAGDARVMLTGATGGIGRAVALHLMRSNAAVMLIGRSAARLAGAVRELAASIGIDPADASRLAWRVADVTDAHAPAELADAAARWGCNVLVHGAGVPAFGPFADVEADGLHELVETNLVAPIRLTHALLPHLRQQPRAHVICIGSALGRIGLPGFVVYGATKFGLRGFAEALRRELGDTRVRVQYLGPRSTLTPFNDAHAGAYLKATGAAIDPPARVADALVRLLESERSERYVGYPEFLAVRVNALASSWLDGAFRKHRRNLNLRTRHPSS